MASPKKKTVKKKSSKKKTMNDTAAKKKVVKKKAVKKSVKKAAKKAAPKRTASGTSKIKVTHDQHYKMVCEAAYYISLEKNPETVNPTEDWLQAETAINKIYCIAD